MEVKKEQYRNITDLEFGVLRELPKLKVLYSLKEGEEDNAFSNLKSNLNKITSISGVFEVIEKVDDGFICLDDDDEFCLIKDCPKVEVGEVYCYSGDNICRVSQELIDDEKFKGLFVEIDKWVDKGEVDSWNRSNRDYCRGKLIGIEEIGDEGITSGLILELLETYKKVVEEKEKEREEEEKEEEKIKKIKINDEEKTYNSKSIGTFNNCSVLRNTIKGEWSAEFVLNKDVNKIFSYEDMGRIKRTYTILCDVETFLLQNKTNYTKIKNGEEKYKVKYVGDKCSVGGVNVPFSKQNFILNRLNSGACVKDIKILLKLNGMKADFISSEDLRWREGTLKIPIKSKAIDDKTFRVEFINKTKTFNWGEIKEWFFYGWSRSVKSYFGNEELLKLCCEIGVCKKDLFETLRRLKMLKELEDKNGN